MLFYFILFCNCRLKSWGIESGTENQGTNLNNTNTNNNNTNANIDSNTETDTNNDKPIQTNESTQLIPQAEKEI